MAPSSPPSSRCASPLWDEWGSDGTAYGMSTWSISLFKAHFGKSILEYFRLWEDRESADFEIHCADQKIKVHKAILRAHSEVLAKICGNRSFKEAISGVLQLKANPYEGDLDNLGDGDDPEIVEEMVYYFYHLELSAKARVTSPWECEVVHIEPSLVYLARIYVLAEKYFIEGLKATIMTDFRDSLARELEHPELIEACHIIFRKTVEPGGEKGLKAIVAKSLADALEKVKKSEMHNKLFQEIPELALRVLKEVPKPLPVHHPCVCGRCDCGRGLWLWNDRVNADFEIVCGAYNLKVHKLVLRNYSDALARVADNKSFKEGKSGQLILHPNPYQKKEHDPNEGDDPEMVREMIHFFYHLEFSDINKIKTTPKACDLLFLARMWPIADKYFVDELKKYVVTLFEGIANAFRESSTTHDCMNDDFESTLRYVYANPDDELFEIQGLQLVLAKVLADMNARKCFATDALYVDVDGQLKHTNGRFRNWLRDIPELAAHICLIQGGGV
ncbi:hypothetical protein KCU99_g1048, partial [Aureobasidium melanogenum]